MGARAKCSCGHVQASDEPFWFCDLAVELGPLCLTCFKRRPCGMGLHTEGCATVMLEGLEDDSLRQHCAGE